MKIWVHDSIIKAALADLNMSDTRSVFSRSESVVSRSDSVSSKTVVDAFSSRKSSWKWIKATPVSGSAQGLLANSSRSKPPTNRAGAADRHNTFTPRQSKPISDTNFTVRVTDPESVHDGKTITITPQHLQSTERGILPANSFKSDTNLPSDLTQLTHLHEPAVVDCLHKRYRLSSGWQMYTSSGPILIAINPCRTVKGLYDETAMRLYWRWGERLANGAPNLLGGDSADLAPPPPHVFAVADAAYRGMMRGLDFVRSSLEEEKKEMDPGIFSNQSILVSGESGAGKTVTTKFIMQYLAALSKKVDFEHGNGGSKSCIEQRVLKSNAILESFGNARTLRNDNSSRFGKFIELRFTDRGRLTAASIDTYLLEKARIVSHTCGERTYHIFYQVLENGSLTAMERNKFFIEKKSASDFIVTTSDRGKDKSHLCQNGFDDHAKMFGELRNAMDTMGFSRAEQMGIFQTVCGLLHLSNLTLQGAFVESDDGEECMLDQNNLSLGPALSLLGVPFVALNAAVTTVQFKAVDELVKKNLNTSQASRSVQALIKGVYDSIFSHLVQRINSCIAGSSSADEHAYGSAAFIGLLDIFGFESFDTNSFEQLCINYCNESLQQQFNRFVFKLEQQEYAREGIRWDFIEFSDNQDILDLIEKKHGGILNILDEQCMLGMRCNDRTFVSAVYDKCASASQRFQANTKQKSQGKFSIRHYAGVVEYHTLGFMEKNKDEIPMEASELFANSSYPFVRNVAQVMATKMAGKNTQRESKKRSFKSSISRVSVGGQFAAQLQQLRRRIDETHPHYVRCLKPNDELQPGRFDFNIVVDQLKCGGILEAIRVSRAGFPQRYTFEQFTSRFGMLSSLLNESRGFRSPERFRSTPQGALPSRKFTKVRQDPRKECESLVKVIAKWILSEREKHTEEEEEPQAKTNNLSPRSFWKSQSPKRHNSVVHKPVDTAEAGIQMGTTKVFLLQDTFDCIERQRGRALSSNASKIISVVRMFLTRTAYLARLHAYRNSFSRRGEMGTADIENDESMPNHGAYVNVHIGWVDSKENIPRATSVRSYENQEFQWVSVGHGRFIKREQSNFIE